jgi:Tol biopolymer transport system component
LQQDANGERMTFAFIDGFIYVMNSDGSNPTKLTEGVSPAWSPDGHRIAYTGNLKEPNPAAASAPESVDADPYKKTPYIFVIDANVRKRLLRRAAMAPAWSPDGKQIAFTLDEQPKTYRDENYTSCGIYVMDADGSGKPRKLATGPGCASTPAWSPEGKKIAYTNGEGVDESGYSISNVYVANAPGEENGTDQPRALTDYSSGLAADPDWSPDGTEIAFSYSDSTGSPSVYKMDADGSGETLIAPSLHLKNLEAAAKGKEVTDGKSSPAWSPDGDQIAYVRSSPYCVPYPCDHDFVVHNEIHIIDSDGSKPILVRDFGKDGVGALDW